MTLPHFFLERQILSEETQDFFPLRLTDEDLRHARVLRLMPGEHIAVIDAAQDYFECAVADFNEDLLNVRITTKCNEITPRPSVVLVQGLSKGEKMDEVIRHATELGVDAFVPFLSERSIVKLDAKKTANRMRRWRSIAKSAAMQSGQRSVPEISEPLALDEVCKMFRYAAAILVCWEEAQGTGIRDALNRALSIQDIALEDARVAVVVGPEGGLSAHEVDAFLSCNRFAESVSLGQSILRTETAGVVAPALVLYELGVLA